MVGKSTEGLIWVGLDVVCLFLFAAGLQWKVLVTSAAVVMLGTVVLLLLYLLRALVGFGQEDAREESCLGQVGAGVPGSIVNLLFSSSSPHKVSLQMRYRHCGLVRCTVHGLLTILL